MLGREILERCILASCISSPQKVGDLIFLDPADFSVPFHRVLWSYLKNALVEDGGADSVMVISKFGKNKHLLDILEELHSDGSPETWAKELQEMSVKDKIHACLDDVRTKIAHSSADESLRALLDGAGALVSGQSGSFLDRGAVLGSILRDALKPSGVYETGIAILDRAMGGGLYPGKSYAICARKKVGKTTMVGTISYNLNEANKKHLFIAAEMSPAEIEQRNIARAIGCDSAEFLKKEKDDAFLERVADYISTAKQSIVYAKKPGITFRDLKKLVSMAKMRHNISGFILDYLQLVENEDKKTTTAEHQLEVAQWISSFCRSHNVWALVTAQINQEGNVRGGESIRLAFDQVFTLHRDSNDPAAYMKLMETRYTKWMDMGSDSSPTLLLHGHGPYFEGYE